VKKAILTLALLVILGFGAFFALSRPQVPVASAPDDGTILYINDALGFSLHRPKDLIVTDATGARASTISFEEPGGGRWFQLFIVPYTGTTITDERLEEDLGGASVTDPTQIVLPGGIEATHFTSVEPELGTTTEVWFLHGGFLYEATTRAADDAWLASILSTWEFR
jgi:hypothetical protein